MVKKLILLLQNNGDNKIYNNSDIQKLIDQNNLLCNNVTYHKNKITYYHNNKSWDKYKKLSNEYELIFTTPSTGYNISNYNPVSRSFFKLWEILYDFNDILFKQNQSSFKCLFLAEGPGGFAEAFIKYRQDKGFFNDDYHGITLKANNDKNIPEWKLQKDIMKKIKINYGEDGTGNLYNYSNIIYLSDTLGKNTIDFITADGGFDFSADFNGQEELSFRLILCEILSAILLQKQGGTFVLKIFDIFNTNTLKLIQILKEYYENIFAIKPLTSRPANSEKYLLCTGFKTNSPSLILLTIQLITIAKNYSDEKTTNILKNIPFNHTILKNLVIFNLQYSIRQIYYIERTIGYINYFNDKKSNDEEMNKILNDHIRKSHKWCTKYNISH